MRLTLWPAYLLGKRSIVDYSNKSRSVTQPMEKLQQQIIAANLCPRFLPLRLYSEIKTVAQKLARMDLPQSATA